MRERKGACKVWWGNLMKRGNLEDIGLDGWIILNWIMKKWNGGIDWMYLAEDFDRWRILLNAIIDL
jgi:hypothetical protein